MGRAGDRGRRGRRGGGGGPGGRGRGPASLPKPPPGLQVRALLKTAPSPCEKNPPQPKPKPKPTHHPPAGADPVGHGLCPALRPPAPPSPAPQGAQDRLGTSRTPRTAPNEPSPALACGPALPRRKGWVGFFLGGGSWEAAPSPIKAAGAAPGADRLLPPLFSGGRALSPAPPGARLTRLPSAGLPL